MKPVVLMVGADKGGVGKTTVTRTMLDYLAAKYILARAFDAEYPRGTLQRFHPNITEVVDITTAAHQMKMIDTLSTSEVKVSVIDIRAGLLAETLRAFTEVGFFDLVRAGDFNFGLFHVVGSSVASLDEIAEVLPRVPLRSARPSAWPSTTASFTGKRTAISHGQSDGDALARRVRPREPGADADRGRAQRLQRVAGTRPAPACSKRSATW